MAHVHARAPSRGHKTHPPASARGSDEKEGSPGNYVGDVVEAPDTDDSLAIKGRFDRDTEHGQVGLPKHQGPPRVMSEHRLRDPHLHQGVGGSLDQPCVACIHSATSIRRSRLTSAGAVEHTFAIF